MGQLWIAPSQEAIILVIALAMKLGDDDKVSGIGEYDLTSQRAYNNNSRKIDRQFLEMTLQRIKKSSTSALVFS